MKRRLYRGRTGKLPVSLCACSPLVNHWVKSFRERQISTDINAFCGHPLESVNDKTLVLVHTLLEEDQWETVCEIKQQIVAEYLYVNVSLILIHTIIHEHLQMTKVSPWWVLCELTNEHQQDRMGAGLEFLF